MAFCFCQKIGSFGTDITGNSVGFGVLGVVLDRATQCPWLSSLLEELNTAGWDGLTQALASRALTKKGLQKSDSVLPMAMCLIKVALSKKAKKG